MRRASHRPNKKSRKKTYQNIWVQGMCPNWCGFDVNVVSDACCACKVAEVRDSFSVTYTNSFYASSACKFVMKVRDFFCNILLLFLTYWRCEPAMCLVSIKSQDRL
jgi:hypothetical protein